MTRWLPAVAISLVLGIGVMLVVAGDPAGHVEIRTHQAGLGYVEGAVRFAQVDGQPIPFTLQDNELSRGINFAETADAHLIGIRSLKLKPGHHRLTVWERPCVGWCNVLDEPVNFAEAEFEIAAGQTLPLSVVFGGPATISVGAAAP